MAIKVEKIIELYEIIKKRLPKSYPKPRLIFFENDIEMSNFHFPKAKTENNAVYGVFDGESTISIPLNVFQEFDYANGTSKLKKVPITSDIDYLAVVLLHELGHSFYLDRYGKKSKQYGSQIFSEQLADQFAYRWVAKMKKEKLF